MVRWRGYDRSSPRGGASGHGTNALMRGITIMAFVFHIHTAPSCETTHSTSCASVDGSDWDHSCFRIESGRNRGKYGCIHRHPDGQGFQGTKFYINKFNVLYTVVQTILSK